MKKSDSNLFEAFRDASRQPEPQASVPVREVIHRDVNPRILGLGVACLGLVFALGYMMGSSGRTVEAQELDRQPLASGVRETTWQPVRPNSSVGAITPPPLPIASKSEDSDASTLYNARNLYTVLAIRYSDAPSLQAHAKSISEFLRSQGLPAFDPVPRAGYIEILVGAGETQGALVELTTKLRGTRGPSGRSYDFQSAYVVNIDDHLDRN